MENQLFFSLIEEGKSQGGISFQHYQSCVAQRDLFVAHLFVCGGIQSVFNGLIVFLQLLFLFLGEENVKWARGERIYREKVLVS